MRFLTAEGGTEKGGKRQARALQDGVHDLLGYDVGDSQIGAGDHHEAQHDGRGLGHLASIGPLHALKLGPARAEEGQRPVAPRTLGTRATAARGRPLALRLAGRVEVILACGGAGGRVKELIVGGRRGEVTATRLALAVTRVGIGGRHLADRGLTGARTAHERGIELIDLARGMLQRSGHVLAHRLSVTRSATLTGTSLLLALLGAFTIAGHDSAR